MRSNVTRRMGQPVGSPIPLLSAFLEVLWAYPWLIWMSSWSFLGLSGPPLSVWAAIAIILVAEEASRFFLALRWPLAVVRLVTVLVLMLTLTFAVRIELGGGVAIWNGTWWQESGQQLAALVTGLLFGVFLLWRGIAIGRTTLTFDDLYRRFFFGLAALVLLFVAWGISSGGGQFQQILASASLFVVAFFFVSLMGLVIVNVQSGQQGMLPQEVVSSLTNRTWISLYLIVILGITGVSTILAFIFSLDIFGLAASGLSVLGTGLLTLVLYVVVLPIAYIASVVFYVGRLVFSLLGVTGEPPELNVIDYTRVREASEGQTSIIPPEAILAIKWFLVFLVISAVAYLLARALFRSNRTEQKPEETIHESLWSWTALRQEFRQLAVSLIEWLYRRKPKRSAVAPPPVATVEGAAGERSFTVREIYEGVLWEGRSAGAPRPLSATPYEYERRLEQHLSAPMPELESITRAYVADRYGGQAPREPELGLLNRLWRRVRAALRAGLQHPQPPDPPPPADQTTFP